MDCGSPFSRPAHLGDQVVPFGQGATQVPLRQLEQQCGRKFVDPVQRGTRQGCADLARGDADQSVQPLIAASLVPIEMTRGVKNNGSPPASVGVDAQGCLLAHGAARQEQRRRFAEQGSHFRLKLAHDTSAAVAVRFNVGRDRAQHVCDAAQSVPVDGPSTAGPKDRQLRVGGLASHTTNLDSRES